VTGKQDILDSIDGGRIMNRQLLKGKAETLSDAEIAEVLEYISIMESVREQVTTPDPLDELIIRLLSDAMKSGLGTHPGHRLERITRN
jgi:hypothetical protein